MLQRNTNQNTTLKSEKHSRYLLYTMSNLACINLMMLAIQSQLNCISSHFSQNMIRCIRSARALLEVVWLTSFLFVSQTGVNTTRILFLHQSLTFGGNV